MKILLYDYYELEEKASVHLKKWKVCHIIIYTAIAVLGILNFAFLDSTKQMVDHRCLFYPHNLAFHLVEIPTDSNQNVISSEENILAQEVAQNASKGTEESSTFETDVQSDIKTIIFENKTHHDVLDTVYSYFQSDEDCQLAEYTPIMSSTFAIVWLVLFVMCPSGGRSNSGIQEPWRILLPSLVFSIVLVVLTGCSFTQTSGGLEAFCAAFYNYTDSNSTSCSSVNDYLESSWYTSFNFDIRVSLTRAASAAVLAGWACATALLLARCLNASDFVLKRTGVYLDDPLQKVIPRSPRKSQRSTVSSPVMSYQSDISPVPDNNSVTSEPTTSTNILTATIEAPETLSPVKTNYTDRQSEILEMKQSPSTKQGQS